MRFRSWGKWMFLLLIGVLSALTFILRRDRSKPLGPVPSAELKKGKKRRSKNINNRQQLILEMFKRKDVLTNDDISAQIPDVTRRTLRRDLVDLEKKKLIRKKGKTRGTYYVKTD